MNVRWTLLATAAAALLAVPARAGGKVEHTNVVEPKYAIGAPADLAPIGQPTRFLEKGGTLYVAGTTGIGALSADGKVLWATPLDATGVRELAIDDAGIAYTGYELTATKESAWRFLGEMPKKLVFAPSVVGLLTPDGKKVWQGNGPAFRISPPCLTPDSIGVLTGESFHIYSRADGKVTVSTMDLEMAIIPDEYAARLNRPRPMWIGGNFVGTYFYNRYRIGPKGEEIYKENKHKSDVMSGPVLYDGKILAGTYTTDMQSNVNKGIVVLLETGEDFEKAWHEDFADDGTPTGDLYVDGSTIFAATNRIVGAIDGSTGKKTWSAEGKDGGLSPSSLRGVRFADNWPWRYWGGQLLVVAGDKLYVATRREVSKKTWADVITVLNKKDGSYVKTIDMKMELVDMAVFGPRIAIATSQGLKFLALD
jgi:outer membrane protein assembly factor BamB